MNGWQRLGTVVATVIAVPVAITVYDDSAEIRYYYEPPPDLNKLNGQEWVNAVYWAAAEKETRLKKCLLKTGRATREFYSTYATVTCKMTNKQRIDATLRAAILPFLVVFGLGYLFAWVRAGFRKDRGKSQHAA